MKKLINLTSIVALLLITYYFFYQLFGDIEVMAVFATPFVIAISIMWLVINRKELSK